MKKQTIIIFIIIGLAILVIANKDAISAWWNKSKMIPPASPGNIPASGGTATQNNTLISQSLDFDKQLRIGSKGDEVRQLQTWLNMIGANPQLKVDGYFGAKTANALKKYNRGATRITLKDAQDNIVKYITSVA